MKKFWRTVREEVVSWPLWAFGLGFAVGSFIAESPKIPMWSWTNVLVSAIGTAIYIGVFYIVKSFCRWSLKREDKR